MATILVLTQLTDNKSGADDFERTILHTTPDTWDIDIQTNFYILPTHPSPTKLKPWKIEYLSKINTVAYNSVTCYFPNLPE